MSDASKVLVDYALSLEWGDIPNEAKRAARRFLFDTLCVGVAGASAAGAIEVRAVATNWSAGGASSVLGAPGVKLGAPQAAFVNAFQIHAQEFDAVHEAAVLHPFSATTAALLAEVDRSGPYKAADVLAALVAGVDVAVGLGLAARSPIKFFRPATAGIFGAVAALARLRRVTPRTARTAFGHALASAAGSMQAHVEGTQALPLQVANAARGAIAAIDLAEAGLSAPLDSIEGPFGYLAQFETDATMDTVLKELGARWRVCECSIKPFPTGRAAHGAICATQSLVQAHGLTADNLAALVYVAPPLIRRLVGRPPLTEMTSAYARLCFPWLGALMVAKGEITLADFTPDTLADPFLRALAAKIGVGENAVADPAAFVPGRAIATFKDGRAANVDIDGQWGSPAQALTEAELVAKAMQCLAFGGCSAAAEKFISAMAEIDGTEDFGVLVAPLAS